MRNLTLTCAFFTAFILLTLYSCEMPLDGDYRTIHLRPENEGNSGGEIVFLDNGRNQGSFPSTTENEVKDAVKDALEDAKNKLDQGEPEVVTPLSIGDAEYTVTLRPEGTGYDVAISGLNLIHDTAVKGFFKGIQEGLRDDDVYLDLSGCTGAYLQPILGQPVVDKSQFVSVTLPITVTELQDFALSPGEIIPTFVGFDNLKKISAPGLTKINDEAFKGMDELVEVNFPAVEEIGYEAFSGCSALTTLQFAPSGDENRVTKIGDMAFAGCASLVEVDFPVLEQFEAYGTFSGCTALTTVNFRSLKAIEQRTFEYCSDLTTLNFTPESIETIGSHAFDGCSSLTAVNFPAIEEIEGYVFYGCTNLATLTLNYNAITSIGDGAFHGCISLPSTISFPYAMVICSGAFSGCTSLVSVTCPLVETIGGYAFSECTNLDTVDFSGATALGTSAFEGCESLFTVNIPNLQTLDAAAFKNCTLLETIIFDDSRMTFIADYAFTGCENLNSVTIPYAEQIGARAFAGCKSLTAVEFPLVTAVGESCFINCENLATVKLVSLESFYLNGDGGYTFDDTSDTFAIHLGATPPDKIGLLTFGVHTLGTKNVTVVVPSGCADAYNNFQFPTNTMGDITWKKAFESVGSDGDSSYESFINGGCLNITITAL